jgi:hypothetical protein
MKSLMKMPMIKRALVTGAALAAGLMASAPADAQVHVGVGLPGVHIGVGVGAPAYYYGPGYYPPGPCDAYNDYYGGDCGYATYNGPVVLDGIAVGGPHYYRWFNGQPYFWYRGGWHFWNGWQRVNFAWDRGEGYGWHGGRFDRGWGDAHWHGERRDFQRGHDDHRGDRDDHHGHDDHH